MSKILISRIKGGLGNQLFCYAAARRLALFSQAELVIDNVSGFTRDKKYLRKYRLDKFSISSRLANASERFEPLSLARRKLVKLINRSRPFELRSYIEQEFSDFDSRLIDMRLSLKSTTIDGLWQSAFYFRGIENILRDDLRINLISTSRNDAAALWIKRNEAICVHVRWFEPGSSIANVNFQYYKTAFNIIKEKIKDPYFVIFSENPSAAKSLLDIAENRALCVDWNLNDAGDVADLWLMTQCKHFIIANSTFSWWGAWLGASERHQMVFFPRLTQLDKLQWAWDYEGQMPETWIPIEI